MKKIARIVMDIFIAVSVILFLLSLLYFLTGSLELEPSAEQQSKAKDASAFLLFCFGILCTVCIGIRIQLRKK